MGACYYVELKTKISDREKFLEMANGFIDDARARGAIFPAGPGDHRRDDPNELLEVIFTKNHEKHERDKDAFVFDTFAFDASYGWGPLMADAFAKMAPALADGSAIHVWPDEEEWEMKVENGEAHAI